MLPDINNFPDDPAQLKKLLVELSDEHAYLKEKYKSLERMLYGKKSEKLTPEDEHQMRLFNKAEDGADDNDGPALQTRQQNQQK